MPQELYAYTLRHQEPGWSWFVYDLEGDLVASGLASSQAAAAEEVHRVIRPDQGASKPSRSWVA